MKKRTKNLIHTWYCTKDDCDAQGKEPTTKYQARTNGNKHIKRYHLKEWENGLRTKVEGDSL